MITTLKKCALALCFTLIFFIPSRSLAQTFPAPSPQAVKTYDEALVDLESRLPSFDVPDLAIGPTDHRLTHTLMIPSGHNDPNGQISEYYGGIVGNGTGLACILIVKVGSSGDCFSKNGTTYSAMKQNGSTLIENADGSYVYSVSNGTIYILDSAIASYAGSPSLVEIDYPTGEKTHINWKEVISDGYPKYRIASVQRSDGYALSYEYYTDTYGSGGRYSNWNVISKITAYNMAYEYCDRLADHCSFSRVWPSVTFSWQDLGDGVGANLSVNLANGESARFVQDPDYRVTSYKPIQASSPVYTYRYCQFSYVSGATYYYGDPCYILHQDGTSTIVYDGVKWATKLGRQWNYNPQLSLGGCGCYYYNVSTDPDGRTATLSAFTNAVMPRVTSFRSVDGTSYAFSDDDIDRLISVSPSGQSGINYQFDARGNTVRAYRVSQDGATTIATLATYPSTCENPITCNKPTNVTDPNGSTWSYNYFDQNGEIAKESSPSVDGTSKVIVNEYVQRYASYENSSGVIVSSGVPTWLLSSKTTCQRTAWTGSACAGGSGDQIKTSYDYGPTSGLNNLLLRSISVVGGGVATVTCYGYDTLGNRISERSPNGGAGPCY